MTSGEPLDMLSSEAIKFCRSVGSQATTVTEIVKQHDFRVYAAIQKGIDAVNQEASSGTHRIQKWVILEKDFSIRGGELGEWPGSQWPWRLAPDPWLVSSAAWAPRSQALFWGSEGLRDQLGMGVGPCRLQPPGARLSLSTWTQTRTASLLPRARLGQPLRPGDRSQAPDHSPVAPSPPTSPVTVSAPPREGGARRKRPQAPAVGHWLVTHRARGLTLIPTAELVSPFSAGPTTKLKRYFITQKYKKQIETLYH